MPPENCPTGKSHLIIDMEIVIFRLRPRVDQLTGNSRIYNYYLIYAKIVNIVWIKI